MENPKSEIMKRIMQREFVQINGETISVNRRNFLHGDTQRNTELHRGIQREFVQITGEMIGVNQRNQREFISGEMMGVNRRNFLHRETPRNTELHREKIIKYLLVRSNNRRNDLLKSIPSVVLCAFSVELCEM